MIGASMIEVATRRFRAFLLRVGGMFHRRSGEDDFAAEFESHVELHIADGIRAGLDPTEARRQALIRLGGAEQARQAHRERRSLPFLESLLQDVRYGARTLLRSPGFTITAVFTLALGIGACTAIFSLVNAVLIRSLPYGDPQRLVYLFTPNPRFNLPVEVFGPAYGDFFDLKRESRSFQSMTTFDQSILTLTAQGPAQRVSAARVDGSFFPTFQAAPALGRAINYGDDQPGHARVAVISHALWQSAFASSANVLSRSLLLNGNLYQIIGVMPPEFGYPHFSDLPYGNSQYTSTQVWVPLALTPEQTIDREGASGNAIARLKPGISIAQAQAEMTSIMIRLDKLHSAEMRGWGAHVENFMDTAVGSVRPLMMLLLGAVCLVLLIACGNAANLLLARAANRSRELGVRAALGAGRARIVRQLLTESLLIGIAGGAAGIALAFIFLRALPYLNPGDIPRLNEATLDVRVLAFAVAVSLLTSVLTGILPAFTASRLHLTDFLKTHGVRGTAGGHSRLQSALIVAQTAVVMVLLAGAGLLIRSYINVESVDLGFSHSTVTTNVELDARYNQPQRRIAFFRDLIGKIAARPGVEAVGAINYLPLSNSESLGFFWVDGFANKKDQLAEGRSVTPHYFSAMNIPLVAGRIFNDDDVSSPTHAAIVNQRFADLYLANRNPIGARISTDDHQKQWDTVVGVVADVHHASLEETPEPQIYRPSDEFGAAYIAVRSVLPPAIVAAELRTTLHAIDPNLALADIHTMADLVSEASARRRFQTSLLTLFAGIALLLALVGLYGLMAYSVSRRTQEVGIRMALGAQRSDVILLVMKNAAWLVGLGLIVGLCSALVATRVLKSFLFGVTEHDPLTILTVCSLLAVCGLLAAFLPARRAASIDPMQALRTE